MGADRIFNNTGMKVSRNIKKDHSDKSIRQTVAGIRKDYDSEGIVEKDFADNPVDQFEKWFNDALENNVTEPNAMHLSTATPDGKPSGRFVLLKGFDERGFVFFTGYDSRKGRELKSNAHAALTFFWHELFRQVRIEGTVQPVSAEESDIYFQSRPRESQVSAASSPQGLILKSRDELEKKVKEIEEKFNVKPIPRPANWGGFRLFPVRIEFWQGKANRLHDRIVYQLRDDSIWTMHRLSP